MNAKNSPEAPMSRDHAHVAGIMREESSHLAMAGTKRFLNADLPRQTKMAFPYFGVLSKYAILNENRVTKYSSIINFRLEKNNSISNVSAIFHL